MKKIILFDLDGTLIDSTSAILHCFYKAFWKFNFPIPDENDIKKLIGHPLDYMFKELGVKENVDEFVKAYKECYRPISKSKTKFLPNAKEAIEFASTFAKLGIVTTKTARYSKELLEHMGVMKYFEVLIGREDVINPKPHPEPVLKALDFFKDYSKENVWMIGDTFMDIVSAKKAGINACGVLSGYSSKEELLKYTNFLAKDSLEATKLICEK